ncbi:MAG: 50S ribosomal protein L4 [Actinomycetota bacterium]
MAKVDVFDSSGKKSGSAELAADVFEADISVPLMHQVVVAAMASQRRGTHSTKTRAQVRGGGKKPWRQKGTGRARHGSIRSPIWVGGGVAHGPQPRTHDMRVNKKMRKGALRSALSDANASGKLVIVDGLSFDEPKTKRAIEFLDALELEGKVLVVLSEPHEATEKSFRNLTSVRVAFAGGLGVWEIVNADRVVFAKDALDKVASGLAKTTRAAASAAQAAGGDAA